MPEVIPQRDASKLTVRQRLEKHVADETELIAFHHRRMRDAEHRRCKYERELAKLTGN